MIPKIVINVQGGIVQSVSSNEVIEVYLIDYDTVDDPHGVMVNYIPTDIYETVDDLFVGELSRSEKYAKKKLIKLMNK